MEREKNIWKGRKVYEHPHVNHNRKRRGSVVVSTSTWHLAGQGSISRHVISCKNLALNIRDCLSVSFG